MHYSWIFHRSSDFYSCSVFGSGALSCHVSQAPSQLPLCASPGQDDGRSNHLLQMIPLLCRGAALGAARERFCMEIILFPTTVEHFSEPCRDAKSITILDRFSYLWQQCFAIDIAWIVNRLSWDNTWLRHALSMDSRWIIHGMYVDIPWTIHLLALDYP